MKSRLRRRLLIAAGLVGGALVVGGYLFYRPRDRLRLPADAAAPPGEAWLTGWLRIGADGHVSVLVPRQEMGQGVYTGLAMLVAEELDCDPASLRVEQAPVDPLYANATMLGDGVPFRPDDASWMARLARHTQYKVGELLGIQATGGSTSTRDAWLPMRRAGAAARAMLVGAAAERWKVLVADCRTEGGRVLSGERSLGYGELAAEAARQPIPASAPLKDPARYLVIGTSLPRLDVPEKAEGKAGFGLDVRLPGMRFAALAQCPAFGGSLKRVDASKAKSMPGVQQVIELEATPTSAAAVAVVADGWWHAKRALDALSIEWNDGPHAKLDTAAQRETYAALLDKGEATVYEDVGNAPAALAAAGQAIEARYEVPYLAHATMEPINATAWVKDGRCEVWVGNQAPTLVQWMAAKPAGVGEVRVHTPYLGGGFGRRSEMDVVVQAAAIAKRLPGVPVQLIWSREEDIQHDVYRPMALARLRCALDGAGGIRAWYHRIVGQSCTQGLTGRLLPWAASDAMKDKTTAEGAFDLVYAMAHRRVEHVLAHQPVPVGFWRSVGHSYTAFFVEGFLDEVAHAAKRDPYEFRRALLAGAPRHRRVLETAAQKAGWGAPLPPRTGRGIALAESFHSIVAQVAEVEVREDKSLRVKRVVCAIDCGKAVNPGIVARQMESGIVYGLSAALYGEITLKEGRVEQSNFPDYEVVRMADCPAVETHLVESGWEHLGGVGEPGTPPIAPAVANAVFAATGERLRKLPLRLA
ncbi:MAG TPA: xanthine dehydrogenase family protein molybdopterin-binding subunit [Burkholderiales bacterium]|nr:xanthine dehydrogenase family protein molybdopterin-binding subunit [Burkholderiales bacterium]